MSVGEKIKNLRKEKGWSQGDLAKKLGVVQPQLNRWEMGKFLPSVKAFKKLSQLFNISIDTLLLEEQDLKKLNLKDKAILSKLEHFDSLSPKDKQTIINLIESLSSKEIKNH